MRLTFCAMMLSAFLAVRASGQDYPVSLDYEMVQITNATSERVAFTYRFEDDKWRSRVFAPNETLFFYDHEPRFGLSIRLDANGRECSLETTIVSIAAPRASDGKWEPDTGRRDQAIPYHIDYAQDGSLVVYRGFPASMLNAAIQRIRNAAAEQSVDTAAIRDAIRTTMRVTPQDSIPTLGHAQTVPQLEQLSELVSKEYAHLLGTALEETPSFEITVRVSHDTNGKPIPAVTVTEPVAAGGTTFLKYVMASALEVPELEVHYSRVCKTCSQIVFSVPDEAQYYVPTLEEVVGIVTNHLANSTPIAIDHRHPQSASTTRLCTSWQYERLDNGRERRWKIMIDLHIEPSPQSGVYGDVKAYFVPQGRPHGDAAWSRLPLSAIKNSPSLRASADQLDNGSMDRDAITWNGEEDSAKLIATLIVGRLSDTMATYLINRAPQTIEAAPTLAVP